MTLAHPYRDNGAYLNADHTYGMSSADDYPDGATSIFMNPR